MQNRYGKKLRSHNKEILLLNAASGTLRFVMALEFQRMYQPGQRVLEIGCGEGDSTQGVLEHSEAHIDVCDISSEMIEACKANLKKFSHRLRFICADAWTYLTASDPYDIILSSWTIHNFEQQDKAKLFSAIYATLSSNGVFLLMDKVYPDVGGQDMLDIQMKRYNYLQREVANDIIRHEQQDYTDAYRMNESPLLRMLSTARFRDVRIVDRVEREVVLIAWK